MQLKERVRQQDRSRKQKYAKELAEQIVSVRQRRSEEHGYLISKGFADDQSIFLQVRYAAGQTARHCSIT